MYTYFIEQMHARRYCMVIFTSQSQQRRMPRKQKLITQVNFQTSEKCYKKYQKKRVRAFHRANPTEKSNQENTLCTENVYLNTSAVLKEAVYQEWGEVKLIVLAKKEENEQFHDQATA